MFCFDDTRGLERLPEHMRDAADQYVQNGVLYSNFLTAVLCNQLVNAYHHADDINTEAMSTWVKWLYNDIPSSCWGDNKKVTTWVKKGGIRGVRNEREQKQGNT